MDNTLPGLPGLGVVSRVVEELKIVTVTAPTRRLQTEEHHAEDLLKKPEHVPLKCAQHQVNIDGI